jgi:hypothetical protein
MPRSIWFCEMRSKGVLRENRVELVVPLYTPRTRTGGLAVQWGRWPQKLKEVFLSLFVDAAMVAERRLWSKETMPMVYFIPMAGQTARLEVDDYRKVCVVW